MSITLLTQPTEGSFVAACAKTWFRAETDLTEAEHTITGVADSGGYVQLTASSFADVVANAVLRITGSTGDYAYLLGDHDVVTAGSTTVVIDLAYTSGSTGTMGTATLILDKFCMGVTHSWDDDGDLTEFATSYVPFLESKGIKDVSRVISSLFYSAFGLVDGWISELNKGVFNIQTAIFEASISTDKSRSVLNSEVVQWFAVRSAMITGRIIEASYQNKLLNGTTTVKVHAGTKVIMSMLTKEGDVSAYYTYNVGATNTNDTEAFDTENYKGNYVFTPVANSTSIQLYIKDDEGNRISEILNVQLLSGAGCNVYPLYWLNRYGGYDVYEFTEIVETSGTGNRIEVQGVASAMGALLDKDFSTEAWKECKLIGRNETQAALEYLNDLVVSPEIYNASGNRVKLLSSNFVTRSRDNVTPEFTILVDRSEVVC